MEVSGQHHTPATVPWKPLWWVLKSASKVWRKFFVSYRDSNTGPSSPLHSRCTELAVLATKERKRKKAKICLSWVTMCSMPLWKSKGRCVREGMRGGGKDGWPATCSQPATVAVLLLHATAAKCWAGDMGCTQVSAAYTSNKNNGKVGQILKCPIKDGKRMLGLTVSGHFSNPVKYTHEAQFLRNLQL